MNAPIIDNAAEHRFEMRFAEDAVAAIYYRIDGDNVVMIHTDVPSEYAGQGLATRLARGAFALIRRSGRKAVLKCPFLGEFYRRHPEHADIVAG